MTIQTFSASEFKAKCLDILDRVNAREFEQVLITKRGRVVAVLTPAVAEADAVASLHGFMRGSVIMPDDIDLTAPVSDEPFAATSGLLHG